MAEKDYDAKLVRRDSDSITISLRGQIEIYEICKVQEFTSERKMMSITVKR